MRSSAHMRSWPGKEFGNRHLAEQSMHPFQATEQRKPESKRHETRARVLSRSRALASESRRMTEAAYLAKEAAKACQAVPIGPLPSSWSAFSWSALTCSASSSPASSSSLLSSSLPPPASG